MKPGTRTLDARPVPEVKTHQWFMDATARLATARARFAAGIRGAKKELDAALAELGIHGPSPYILLAHHIEKCRWSSGLNPHRTK